jgi:hypothetical protein
MPKNRAEAVKYSISECRVTWLLIAYASLLHIPKCPEDSIASVFLMWKPTIFYGSLGQRHCTTIQNSMYFAELGSIDEALLGYK